MAKHDPVPFKTPVGRLVWGSVHKARLKKDAAGNPKLIKSGDSAGQPLSMFEFGVAIPKTQAQWQAEPGWGQAIYAEAMGAWPGGQTQRPDFAWKIIDGDSTIPNKNNNRPCDQTGYAGHWVLSFSGMSAPKIAVALNPGVVTWSDQTDLINAGDYIEVAGSVSGNDSAQTAGVYLNHQAVCLRGYGERIAAVIDLSAIGFGGAPVPAGASTVPVGQALAPQPPAATPTPTPVAVTPNPAFLPVPPTPPAARMVRGPSGSQHPYADMLAAGWTDAAMLANGYTL
jgi:hypothetical protein